MMSKRKDAVVEQARCLGTDAKRAGRSAWLATLGAIELAREEGVRWYERLVAKGEDVAKDEENVLHRAYAQVRDRGSRVAEATGKRVQGGVSSVLHRAGVPDRQEVQTLIARVEQLTERVKAMGTAR